MQRAVGVQFALLSTESGGNRSGACIGESSSAVSRSRRSIISSDSGNATTSRFGSHTSEEPLSSILLSDGTNISQDCSSWDQFPERQSTNRSSAMGANRLTSAFKAPTNSRTTRSAKISPAVKHGWYPFRFLIGESTLRQWRRVSSVISTSFLTCSGLYLTRISIQRINSLLTTNN